MASAASSASPRLFGLGLALLAGGVALRWLLFGSPVGQGRLRALVEVLLAERAALLIGLHVAAMTVLSAGILGSRAAIAVPACAFWSGLGALLECSQHPIVIGPLTRWAAAQSPDSLFAEALSLYLLNGEFSRAELLAPLVGGWLGLACIQRFGPERSSP